MKPGSKGAASGGIGGRGPPGVSGNPMSHVRKAGHKKNTSHDGRMKDGANSLVDEEARRKERRRLEAKNAIEVCCILDGMPQFLLIWLFTSF
jgi:hypothetical protein